MRRPDPKVTLVPGNNQHLYKFIVQMVGRKSFDVFALLNELWVRFVMARSIMNQ